jgi:hypothetical protein
MSLRQSATPIRTSRDAQSLAQEEELAEKVGVTRAAFARIRRCPRLETLAKALAWPVTELPE